MIAHVRGRVTSLGPATAVVEVGGIGLALECTPTTLSRLRVGEESTLAAALVVREDSLTLYGFADADERVVFDLVQTATGVGPRLAQAMLAVHSPDALRRAVATDDLTALIQVPGIGRKVAQRIVLELKDRLGAPTGSTAPRAAVADAAPWRGQLASALEGLGWSPREAEEALTAVEPQVAEVVGGGGSPDVALLLRTALRTLSRA